MYSTVTGETGASPLAYACLFGDVEAVMHLLSCEADVNFGVPSALISACSEVPYHLPDFVQIDGLWNRTFDNVLLLLSNWYRGKSLVDIDAKDEVGNTALELARRKNAFVSIPIRSLTSSSTPTFAP